MNQVRLSRCRLLNLDEMGETSSVQDDEFGLESSMVVDVPSQKPR